MSVLYVGKFSSVVAFTTHAIEQKAGKVTSDMRSAIVTLDASCNAMAGGLRAIAAKGVDYWSFRFPTGSGF